jgi:hypothetical protein
MKKLTLMLVIAINVICFAQFALSAGPNLLTNGDFENGQIAPWQGATDAYISTDAAHGGGYGVHLPSAQQLSQGWIAVEPGKTYVFIGWFKWTAFSGSDWGYDTFSVTNTNFESEGGINNLHAQYEKGKWHKLAVTFTAHPQVSAPEMRRSAFNFSPTVTIRTAPSPSINGISATAQLPLSEIRLIPITLKEPILFN